MPTSTPSIPVMAWTISPNRVGLSTPSTLILAVYRWSFSLPHDTATSLLGSALSMLTQSLRCTVMPLLCVTHPTIWSPGIGRQHWASETRTPEAPSTTISESASLLWGGAWAGMGSGACLLSDDILPSTLAAVWFPVPTETKSSSVLR